MNKEIPLYNIIVEYDDDGTEMLRNSFVDRPAVEFTKFAFSKQSTQLKFASVPTEQKFMSVSILADTPILRIDEETGEEFYVQFTKETVAKIVNKLVMRNKTNEVSYQHTNQLIEGVYLVESFIVEKGRVESPLFDVPDGSWISTYWVPNKEQYQALLNDENFNGFSIELNAKIAEAFSSVVNEDILLDDIQGILANETLSDELKYDEIKKVLNKK